MLCALAGFFLWVLCDTVVKLGGQAALSPFMILAFLGVTAFASIGGSVVARQNIALLRPRKWRFHALICLCGIGVNFANVVALKYLPLTIFYIVVFSAPLVIAFFSALMKHEVLTKTKVLCLFAGFFGVVLAVATRQWESGEGIGYIAAMASVLCFSAASILMRRIAQTETVESLQLFRAGAIGLFGIMGVLLIQPGEMPGLQMTALLVVAGIFNAMGNVLNNRALQHTAASNVEQLHYTQLVWGAILGFLLWNEIPTGNLIAGSAIIIVSGILVAREVHKNGNA